MMHRKPEKSARHHFDRTGRAETMRNRLELNNP